MSYSRFRGAPQAAETTYEYDNGLPVRSVTVTEPDWSAADRGLLLALLAERADTCPSCGHPMSVCRDPRTRGTWQVVEETCYPSQVAQAAVDNAQEQKQRKRGVIFMTRRSRG